VNTIFDKGRGYLITGSRIVEDRNLVDYVEDWSKVRSPSRARRRLKRGFAQNIQMSAVARQQVYSLDGGRTLVMHPDVARAFERELQRDMDRLTERAIMTGKL